jgi:hypothetical protein
MSELSAYIAALRDDFYHLQAFASDYRNHHRHACGLHYWQNDRAVERFGALHEYYQPETGEPILNRGFQSWNYLVMNMAACPSHA